MNRKNRFHYLYLFIFCLLPNLVHAQVTIHGNVGDDVDETMYLYSCRNGFAQQCASVSVGGDKCFTLSAKLPTEGFYMLGNNESVKHVLYLKGDEKLNVSFTNNELDIIRGAISQEAQLLGEWEKAASPIRMQAWYFSFVRGGQSSAFDLFSEELIRLKKLSEGLNKKLTTLQNESFGKLMKLKMEADIAFFTLAYRRSHITEVGDDFITDEDLVKYDRIYQQTKLLELPLVPEMISVYVDYKAEKSLPAIENPTTLSSVELKARANLLPEKALRELYLYQLAVQMRYYEKYAELRETFSDEPFSEQLEQQLRPVEKRLAWSKPGLKAPDFKGERIDGTWLSLSELRGKVVVIDVWATWCVPCLRMIPYFKQLEKELSDPELTFMSVCIGASPEKDLWEKLVNKHQLSGNVVFVQGWTKGFAADYRVTGVPRFMIIDREGKVYSFAAPSPKYPQLKQMILQALQKK